MVIIGHYLKLKNYNTESIWSVASPENVYHLQQKYNNFVTCYHLLITELNININIR